MVAFLPRHFIGYEVKEADTVVKLDVTRPPSVTLSADFTVQLKLDLKILMFRLKAIAGLAPAYLAAVLTRYRGRPISLF